MRNALVYVPINGIYGVCSLSDNNKRFNLIIQLARLFQTDWWIQKKINNNNVQLYSHLLCFKIPFFFNFLPNLSHGYRGVWFHDLNSSRALFMKIFMWKKQIQTFKLQGVYIYSPLNQLKCNVILTRKFV